MFVHVRTLVFLSYDNSQQIVYQTKVLNSKEIEKYKTKQNHQRSDNLK